MHGKPQAATRGTGRTANKEQARSVNVVQDGSDEGQHRVQKMIKEIIETTRCSHSQAELALLDASNNVEEAVNNILENSNLDTWSHYSRKGVKKEEREEPAKKEGKRQGRRNNQRDGQPKGARNVENGNTEGHENRQPREKEDGNRRNQRSRREPGAKREGKKNVPPEHREDGDEHWKNGPLVFNRRENFEEKEQPTTESAAIKSASGTAGPLSYADMVRKQKAKPAPPVVSDSPFKLQTNDSKQAPPSPNANVSNEGVGFLTETSKSPRQSGRHLDMESSGGLLREDGSSVTFDTQPSSQKLQESLTAQLKNDLGLGKANNFPTSPPKNYSEPLHQNKTSTVKAGVVEFLSGEAVSSSEWQFGFEATPQNTSSEGNQFSREPSSKPSEPSRNDVGLPSSNLSEQNSSRGNASTVLNQYVQQQQQFSRNRNGVNNLPFASTYSDNFNSPDLRYGAPPSSPPKTQPVQQQIQSQQTHHHQQHMFPPTQLSYGSYPYMSMYSPVAPGLREDFGLLPFHQYNLNQMSMDLLMGGPQLANATSAGPLPTTHQGGHHQNSHQPSVQQGLHNQNSHSQNQPNHQRNEHFNETMFLGKQMGGPPSSQNNTGANGHNQANSNLGNNQRQPLLDNSQQGSVGPPPGFPFISQRNIYPVNPAFPGGVSFNQFPYVMPKSK